MVLGLQTSSVQGIITCVVILVTFCLGILVRIKAEATCEPPCLLPRSSVPEGQGSLVEGVRESKSPPSCLSLPQS